jgi:hypothetical protein
MQQVPADRVIALLTTEIADMHRENSILKVQVEMMNEQLTLAQNAALKPAEVQPTAAALPPVPANSSPLYDATTSSLAAQGDVVPAPTL